MKISEIRKLDETKEITGQADAFLKIPDDLSPYIVYLILQDLLGLPNSDFDPTKSEWAFSLEVPGSIIEVYDWKLSSVSINVYTESNDHEEAMRIGQELIEILKKQSQKHNAKIKSEIESTNTYILQNPFALYYASAENIMNELSQMHLTEDLCRSAFFLFIASFEGFLNLIYELYLKPELKDERIYDRLAREQIDIKIRLAPVYCSCFRSNLIDSRSESFKNFHSIINLRNDFIHANLTKAMKTPVIIDNGRRLMHFPVTRDKSGLPKNIDELSASDLQHVKESIDKMVDILIQDMKPRYKREFKEVINKRFLLIEVEENELIILGGDNYIS